MLGPTVRARRLLPALHQCRFDRDGIASLRTGSHRAQDGRFDVGGDRRLRGTRCELCLRDPPARPGLPLTYPCQGRSGLSHQPIFLESAIGEACCFSGTGVDMSGRHDIPKVVIRRRFASGFANFSLHYRAAVDAWALYDNSGLEWGERA